MTEQLGYEPPTFSEALAEEIRNTLHRNRIKQRQIADLLQLSSAQVSQRLSGRTPFRFDEVDILAGALQMPMHELVRRAENLRSDHDYWESFDTRAILGIPQHASDGMIDLEAERAEEDGGATSSLSATPG